MTQDEIRLITYAVRAAIKPDLDVIHGRVTELATTVSAIDERLHHIPTKSDMANAVVLHSTRCAAGRRWVWGIFLGLPAVALATYGIVSAIVG